MEKSESFKLAVDTNGLKKALGCGRTSALKVGMEVKAEIRIGKRVLWNISKIQKYLDSVSK